MYPSSLSDEEWKLICDHFEPRDSRGKPPQHDKKVIVDAILYVIKGGIPWRMLPKDFPPWQTVYDYFSQWNRRGVWETALDELNRLHRKNKDRNEKPSYGIVDSQSVKTQYASEEKGIDGNKKVKGRKRHIVVDILGNLVAVIVHAANQSDTISGCEVLEKATQKHSTIEAFSADAGYRGTAENFVSEALNLELHISERIEDKFAVLPKRWIVERTFAWLGNFRRLAKDFEILTSTAENVIRVAMLKLTVANCL